MQVRLQIVTTMVAASYLTLGVADAGQAERLWWAYGLVTFVLAVVTLWLERKNHVP